MHLATESSGKSYVEWTLLAVVLLGALPMLSPAVDAAGTRVQGADVELDAARARSEHIATRAMSSIRARHDDRDEGTREPSTTKQDASPAPDAGVAPAGVFGNGTVTFVVELIVAGVKGFATAAIEDIASTVALVSLAGEGLAHEANAITALGLGEYVQRRSSTVKGFIGDALSDPARIRDAVLGVGSELIAYALRIPAIVTSGASATAVGHALGTALYENPFRNWGKGAATGHSNKLASHLKGGMHLGDVADKASWGGVPFVLKSLSDRTVRARWPNLRQAPTIHPEAVWRLAQTGKFGALMQRISELTRATLGSGQRDGRFAPSFRRRARQLAAQEWRELDEEIELENGRLLRREQSRHFAKQFQAMLSQGHANELKEPDFTPSPEAIARAVRRDFLDEDLLALPIARELEDAVTKARDIERRVSISRALRVDEGDTMQDTLLQTRLAQYEAIVERIEALEVRFANAELSTLVGHVAASRSPGVPVDVDLFPLIDHPDMLVVYKTSPRGWWQQPMGSGRHLFAERIAETAHVERELTQAYETVLHQIHNRGARIVIRANHVPNPPADLSRPDMNDTTRFLFWLDKPNKTFNFVEQGVRIRPDIAIPNNALIIDDLFRSASSRNIVLREAYDWIVEQTR